MLPKDIINIIIGYLNLCELVSLSRVNKQFFELTKKVLTITSSQYASLKTCVITIFWVHELKEVVYEMLTFSVTNIDIDNIRTMTIKDFNQRDLRICYYHWNKVNKTFILSLDEFFKKLNSLTKSNIYAECSVNDITISNINQSKKKFINSIISDAVINLPTSDSIEMINSAFNKNMIEIKKIIDDIFFNYMINIKSLLNLLPNRLRSELLTKCLN